MRKYLVPAVGAALFGLSCAAPAGADPDAAQQAAYVAALRAGGVPSLDQPTMVAFGHILCTNLHVGRSQEDVAQQVANDGNQVYSLEQSRILVKSANDHLCPYFTYNF